MERTINFYCKKCKKNLGISYTPCGNAQATVFAGVTIKCNTNKCTRTLVFKKVTEEKILENVDKDNKFYV